MQVKDPNFKLSIILATYNWPKALDLILIQLVGQLSKLPNAEIIVADDGSTSDTSNIIQKHQANCKVIHHVWHEDIGFTKSIILNKAVSIAKGDYLIFIDGDCIPFPDYLANHLKLIQEKSFVAGNRVLLSKEFTHTILNKPIILEKIFKWGPQNWFINKLLGRVNKFMPWLRLNNGEWRFNRCYDWKYPKGCNFGVFKQDFLAVNGFDEQFCGWGHEDADLFIRLLHYGLKIKNGRFSIPVLHLWHKEFTRNLEPKNWQRLMNRLADKKFIRAIDGIDKVNQEIL